MPRSLAACTWLPRLSPQRVQHELTFHGVNQLELRILSREPEQPVHKLRNAEGRRSRGGPAPAPTGRFAASAAVTAPCRVGFDSRSVADFRGQVGEEHRVALREHRGMFTAFSSSRTLPGQR